MSATTPGGPRGSRLGLCILGLVSSVSATGLGCADEGTSAKETGGDAGEGGGDGADDGAPPVDLSVALSFLDAMGGLWVGPVTMTPLGEFPTMNMDARSIDGRTLFSRADLDADNSLRFAFAIEDHGDGPELIYRNGGLFSGLVRDSRTRVRDADIDAGIWRFCSIERGCDYIDATFEIAGDDLLLDVKVRGEQHVYWTASRLETRSLPDPFPVDEEPVGDGTNDFPPMPTLDVDASWSDPLAEPADVWIIISTTECGSTGDCVPSRACSVAAPAGATSVSATIEQIHPGPYFAAGVLDRNRNFFSANFPDAGDTVSIPDAPIDVAPAGASSLSLQLVVDL